jgi:hypothetical protein
LDFEDVARPSKSVDFDKVFNAMSKKKRYEPFLIVTRFVVGGGPGVEQRVWAENNLPVVDRPAGVSGRKRSGFRR